jgi:predicted membrane-bound spermidine synthase
MATDDVVRSQRILLYGATFVVGAVVMGFEMIGSRYLYPYFGGGIGTWAGLISTVLLALAIGYYAGGQIVDRWPSTYLIAIATGGAAAYLVCVPLFADRIMNVTLTSVGDGPLGILVASSSLLVVPLSLLGTLSPVIVRLITKSRDQVGSVSGVVYAVSTLGNVLGTLATAFILIPEIGSRAITYAFSVALAMASVVAFSLSRSRRK